MTDQTNRVSEDFRRARRNLMVLSVLIIVLKVGGIGISNLAFLGTTFSVENYVAIYAIMWLVFAYFAWRYVQKAISEPDLGIIHEYLTRLSSYTFDAMRKNAIKKFPEATQPVVGGFHIGQLTKLGAFKRKANVVIGQDGLGQQEVDEYTLNLLTPWLWPYHVRTAVYVLIIGNLFTEHLLPPLLAIAALVVGFSGWDGGITNVIGAP